MDSDGPPRLEYVDFGDDAMRTSVRHSSRAKSNVYWTRLPIFSVAAGFHDIIEVEPKPDGTLRFERVVTPSRFKTVLLEWLRVCALRLRLFQPCWKESWLLEAIGK